MRNIFDQYDQPENRLTHALMTTLSMDRKLIHLCAGATLPKETRCSYAAIVGKGGDDSNVGPVAQEEFNFTAPKADWYRKTASCRLCLALPKCRGSETLGHA